MKSNILESDSIQIEERYANLELTTIRVESKDQNGTRSKNVFKYFLRKFDGKSTTQHEQRRKSQGTSSLLDNDENEVYYSVPYKNYPDVPPAEIYSNTSLLQTRDTENDYIYSYESRRSPIANQNNYYNYYSDSTWYVADNKLGSLNTQLLDAIENNNTTEVERLLHDEASPNATCRAANISACHAAAYSNSDALCLLLKHKAVRKKDSFGRTPLHLAAWVGSNRNVAMLLDIPEDLRTKVISTITPEVEEEIKVLRPRMRTTVDVPCKMPVTNTVAAVRTSWQDSIDHKCRKYMRDVPMFFDDWTPLHIASLAAHPNTTRLLLAAGANPNSKDAVGRTPLDIAGGKIHEIDLNSYVETLKILIDYGGELNWEKTSYNFDSALHIAVELCSVDAIKILLAVGAPITYHNIRGNTPLHECVLKFYKEPLKVLAKHKRRLHTYSPADVRDSSGNTVLHTAINISWLPGVRIALDAGADITCEDNNGLTGLHLAALKGNPDILNEAINAAKYINAVIHESKKVESPLLCAIRSSNLDCVQTVIDAGAPLKVTTYFDPGFKRNEFLHSVNEYKELNLILHAAAETSTEDVLQFLLDHDQNIEELLEYRCPYLMNTTPIEFAAVHNKFENFKYLLHRTVAKAKMTNQIYDPSALLDIVANLDLENVFKEIIKLIPEAVYIARERGHYPLHMAIRHSKKNMILQLIKNGADLSQCDVSGNTAINLIFDHRSHPTEFISSILDCHIQTNHPIYDPACEITVDYSVLIPTVNTLKEGGQMQVLTALLKTGNARDQLKLLAHPLIESFLYLKWKTLSKFFYTIVFIYILFVVSLSIYIVSVYYYKDKGSVPSFYNPSIWQYLILATIYPIVIQELSCANLTASRWMTKALSIEFWVKFATYSFAIITPVIITKDTPDTEWRRNIASVTLVLAWLNVMLLLSRTPMSGYYMQMFWQVSTKVIKILLIFSCLIFMFSFCFMVQFHTRHPFDGPWPALVKTLVMMTSEFDYDDTFTNNVEKNPFSIQILRVVFVIFLILAAIVLMNLMIGVAVHDVQDLIMDGNLRRLEKLVEFLNNLEVPCEKESFLNTLGLYKWFGLKKVQQTVVIKPGKESELIYTRKIKELIMNKADNQFNKLKKKEDIVKNETKLNEILHATVMKEQSIIKIESKLNDALNAVTAAKLKSVKVKSKWHEIIQAILKKRDTQHPSKVDLNKDKNMTKLEEIFQAISTTEININKIEHKLESFLEAVTSKTRNDKNKNKRKMDWTRTHRILHRRNKARNKNI